jgi:hypothetical protein
MWRISWLIAAACGCGRLGFDGHYEMLVGDGTPLQGDGRGSDGAPAVAPPCGTTVRFYDSFTPGMGEVWSTFASLGYGLVIQNNRLELSFPTDAPTSTSAGLKSNPLDTTASCMDILLATAPVQSAPVDTYVFMQTSGVGAALWRVQGGNLIAAYSNPVADPIGVAGSAPYVPATHRYLRIQEAAGALYWATSSDDVTYTPFASLAPDMIDFSSTSITIAIEATTQAANAGMAWYGTISVTGP